MQGNISQSSGSAVSELLQIIKDFSSCLNKRKQKGNTFLSTSESSQILMQNWGRAISPQPSTFSQSFLFEGSQDTDVFIIDSEGDFFKGEKGQLLAKILGAMNLSTDQVFICNAEDTESIGIKIKEISPKVIVTLGTKASQSVLDTGSQIDKFRGKFHEYAGIKVMPTFHPSRLLRHPEDKRAVWEDMKQVMAYAGIGQ